ncbi:hypothetical protein EH30_09895 [Erythrobacter sp. JL475]|nr:hypothetical protein EH30_09895 [Erythrobacter sp. JL475]
MHGLVDRGVRRTCDWSAAPDDVSHLPILKRETGTRTPLRQGVPDALSFIFGEEGTKRRHAFAQAVKAVCRDRVKQRILNRAGSVADFSAAQERGVGKARSGRKPGGQLLASELQFDRTRSHNEKAIIV